MVEFNVYGPVANTDGVSSGYLSGTALTMTRPVLIALVAVAVAIDTMKAFYF